MCEVVGWREKKMGSRKRKYKFEKKGELEDNSDGSLD